MSSPRTARSALVRGTTCAHRSPISSHLGIALTSEGGLDEAMDHFRQALAIQPDFADAHRNLAIARARKKAGR
jgi:Flp pilus assembly protein TadD